MDALSLAFSQCIQLLAGTKWGSTTWPQKANVLHF